MAFGSSKIIKTEVLSQSGALLVSSEKNFVFPKNIDSNEESILIIKGSGMPELDYGTRVTAIAYTKAGDRISYVGDITMSHERQMNVSLHKSGGNRLEERRRFFKIKVSLAGRALFIVRGEETVRFEEPVAIRIADINVGGVFMVCDYDFLTQDSVCVEIDIDGYRLNTSARVLRIQRGSEGEILGFGCEFESLTAAQEDVISKYINRQQLLQRAKEQGDL